MFHEIVTIRYFIFLTIIFSKYFTEGLKCELKGLLNNRVQCLLHDRGINAANDVVNINGTLTWMTTLMKSEASQPWKFSQGLDRNKTFFAGHNVGEFKKHLNLIMPDTRWCGDFGGYFPTSYEDLMHFVNTDRCCKLHDECIPMLGVNQENYSLSNSGLFARFHCDCEKEFHRCLKDINTTMSNKIGYTYFTILGPQCFNEEYPIDKCTKWQANRCIAFRLDMKQDKKYQWFDVPTY
ncbi:hypothetical protein Zmor_020474 [Zophobas morio]|uniref:phospholipase A2 n=2 Tax=Zophobas morio TaxID=2755281 RepID=A0AA38I3F6_9CUCU|nr:hypothetical protein Zmor_020474 [Zophobas morio]